MRIIIAIESICRGSASVEALECVITLSKEINCEIRKKSRQVRSRGIEVVYVENNWDTRHLCKSEINAIVDALRIRGATWKNTNVQPTIAVETPGPTFLGRISGCKNSVRVERTLKVKVVAKAFAYFYVM